MTSLIGLRREERGAPGQQAQGSAVVSSGNCKHRQALALPQTTAVEASGQTATRGHGWHVPFQAPQHQKLHQGLTPPRLGTHLPTLPKRCLQAALDATRPKPQRGEDAGEGTHCERAKGGIAVAPCGAI